MRIAKYEATKREPLLFKKRKAIISLAFTFPNSDLPPSGSPLNNSLNVVLGFNAVFNFVILIIQLQPTLTKIQLANLHVYVSLLVKCIYSNNIVMVLMTL